MHRRFVVVTLCFIVCLVLPRLVVAQNPEPTALIQIHLPLVMTPDASIQTAEQQKMAKDLLVLVNAERSTAGCGPVRFDERLTTASQGHSRSMAEENYFGHVAPDGTTARGRADAVGYEGLIGENIAAGQSTAEQVMQGWMNSAGHRDNIMNCRYTQIGIGYLYESNDAPGIRMPSGETSDWPFYHYWTQMFGMPE